MALLFAVGVAVIGLCASVVAISIYRLLDTTGMERGWWQ